MFRDTPSSSSSTGNRKVTKHNAEDDESKIGVAHVVVQGLLPIRQHSEVWCTEAPRVITVRSTEDQELSVKGHIALSSKGMPASTTALCLCLAEQRPDNRTRREVWTSWASGHVAVIDLDSHEPLEYVRWDPPHPIHSFVFLPNRRDQCKHQEMVLLEEEEEEEGLLAEAPSLMVGLSLDGCLSVWDLNDRRVITSLSVTVGSKCSLTAVPARSRSSRSAISSKNAYYVYAGFDDGSIRCFLVKAQLVSAGGGVTHQPRTSYRATIEVAESRSLYDIHHGSVLALAVEHLKKRDYPAGGPSPPRDLSDGDGHAKANAELALWTGGEDGTLRRTFYGRGVSSQIQSTIVLHGSGGGDGEMLASSPTPSKSHGRRPGTNLSPQSYCHKILLCGAHLIVCTSDGTLSILTAATCQLLQRVQFQHPLCVRELCQLSASLLEDPAMPKAAGGDHVKRVLLSLSDGSLRNVSIRLTDEEIREKFGEDGTPSPRDARASINMSEGGWSPQSLEFSPEEEPRSASHVPRAIKRELSEPVQPFAAPENSVEKSGPSDPYLQHAMQILNELKRTESTEEQKRKLAEESEQAEREYLTQLASTVFWKPFLQNQRHIRSESVEMAGVFYALQAHVAEEKSRMLSNCHREREDMLSLLLGRTAQVLRKKQSSLEKLSGSLVNGLVEEWALGRGLIEEIEAEQFALLAQYCESLLKNAESAHTQRLLDGLTCELDEINQMLFKQEKEINDARELQTLVPQLIQERDEARATVEELQRALSEQKTLGTTSGEDLAFFIGEHCRLHMKNAEAQEQAGRWAIQQEWEQFWRVDISRPVFKLQSLHCEQLLLDVSCSKDYSVKHASEVAFLRNTLGDYERKIRAQELKLGAAERQVTQLEDERRTFADETEHYRARLAQSEAEIITLSEKHGDHSAEFHLVQHQLEKTLALAEESCRTVEEQKESIHQLRQRLSGRDTAIRQLVTFLNTQLLATGGMSMEARWLTESKALLRDAMYDLACARRGGRARESPRTSPLRQRADASSEMLVAAIEDSRDDKQMFFLGSDHSLSKATEAAIPPGVSAKLGSAFEKVRTALDRCLEEGAQSFLSFDRVTIQDLTNQVEREMIPR